MLGSGYFERIWDGRDCDKILAMEKSFFSLFSLAVALWVTGDYSENIKTVKRLHTKSVVFSRDVTI